MNILTFDLGSHMAVANNLWGFPQVEAATFDGNRQDRAAATLEWLQEMARASGAILDAVVYERPFARGMHATRSLWGIAGLIEAVFAPICAVVDITPGQIKEWATGNGKASKEDMIARAQALGYNGSDEHEADAWVLLHYAEANLSKEK